MKTTFTSISDLRNYVEEGLGDGGDLSREQLEFVRDYIVQQIRNQPDFEWGADIIYILNDSQWESWLDEALQDMEEV